MLRASEGKTVEVPYRGDVNATMLDVLGGVRSTCTYIGAVKLKVRIPPPILSVFFFGGGQILTRLLITSEILILFCFLKKKILVNIYLFNLKKIKMQNI